MHAVAGLGKVRAAQQEYEAAIAAYRSVVERYPAPDYVIGLGDVYRATGQAKEAAKQYALVEIIDRLYEASGINWLLISRIGSLRLRHRVAHVRAAFGHHHSHVPPPSAEPRGVTPWKSLIALGLADGLTPSPSTLVVLLAASSLNRIGVGLLLIFAFSVGMGAVLTLLSLALVYAPRILRRLH